MNFREQVKYFKFTKEQRIGVFLLFAIIVVLQLIYFFVDFNPIRENDSNKQEWLSLQTEVDSLKLLKSNEKRTMFPFNPNFISDYKGYKLGMTVEEIDRLLAFGNKINMLIQLRSFKLSQKFQIHF
jgi:hypothetical protein